MSKEKADNVIPNWYCPYKIPTEFVGSVPPLVYLAGLDTEKNQVHRGIWEMIKMKPSTKDFQPTYVDVPIDHKFPVKKQKNDQIENYIPRGILKSNWLNKHLQLVPSVVVTFFDINWTDPYWNDKKNECARRVRELKSDLAVHGSQILVMLIKTMDAGEDNFSTDRASALCAAADIPPKALYILSHTHSERIQACVQRLEIGMKEASKVYYSGRIRRVKNWKDRTQDLALLARYNFKTAFFQEIRRDYVSALSHYHASHEMLRSLKVTESNVQQIRCVSSWINYRICRLNLVKLDYKESLSHFEKHIRSFKNIEGNRELAFEQLAWMQTQYSLFGELLRHFYRPTLTSLDPVTYFLMAVDYSEKRGQHCKAHLMHGIEWPEEMNEFVKDCDVDYVGQRPWRKDAFGPDTVFVPEDSNAIQALQYLESKYKHSDDRIKHLGIASDFCRDQQRLRTRCQLMMMMGIEFFAEEEYHRAVMLMTHVLREFGRDKGTILLYLVAECGLRAACCDGDISSYLSFLVFLLKRDFDNLVPSKRRELLWCKLLAVLDKRIPMAEQGCIPNEDKWRAALASPYISYVGVHRKSILEATFYFSSEIVRAATPAEVRVVLVNKVDFPISISKFGVGISITDYNCENLTNIQLKPEETQELSLSFTPHLKDVGKVIQIHLGYVDIGKPPDASIILHYSAVMGISPYLWNDGKKEKVKQIIAKIEPMVPLLRPKISRDDPMLVNEWHKVLISWTNTDTHHYTKVHVTILVNTVDPSDIILTTDPHKPDVKFGTVTYSTEVENLKPNESVDTLVYIKCMKPRGSEIQILTKVKYVDNHRQVVTNELVEPVELIKPFEVTQKIRDLQTLEKKSILPNEEFLMYFTIKNASKSPLYISSAKLNKLLPVVETTAIPPLELNNVTLLEGEIVQLVNGLALTESTDLSLGNLEIVWRRDDEGIPACTTEIAVSPVAVSSTAAIYVEGIFNRKGRGELKEPMPVKFCIHNRSKKVYDLWVSLESTECFMNAGPRKTNIKITALESVDMQYILFPLKTGLLKTPRLVIDTVSPGSGQDPHDKSDSPSIVHKNVVKQIFVARADNEKQVNRA